VHKLPLGSWGGEVSAIPARAHPERRRRCRGIAPDECLEQTGVEFSEGSNEGGAQSMSRRFGRTTSAKKSKGGAYGKGVGLGISVLLALIVISLAVWLLRRSARDESTSATPEPGEGVEAGVEEEAVVPPDTPSTEDVPPREEPPPGEERPERRGETSTSPPTPREEPPPGEERPGRR
jgi:hypothetical protein